MPSQTFRSLVPGAGHRDARAAARSGRAMSAPDILPAGETALPATRDVDSAYAWCRQIAHRYGSNFSVGFRFLPREKRRAVYAAYAFCRWADDIADEGEQRAAVSERALDEWQC